DATVRQVVRSPPAEHDGPVLLPADEHPPDVRVLRQRRDQARMPLVDLLEREPPLLLHQVDETEVPRSEHDDLPVGYVVLRALLLLLAAGRLRQGVPDHRALLVASRELGDLAGLERPLDQVVEAEAVPL